MHENSEKINKNNKKKQKRYILRDIKITIMNLERIHKTTCVCLT